VNCNALYYGRWNGSDCRSVATGGEIEDGTVVVAAAAAAAVAVAGDDDDHYS